MKRSNANIDGDTPMGTMLQYGSEAAKDYYDKYLLTPEQSRAHREGWIHIHDFDFYALTTTCCQIDLLKLFKGGFSTGHGLSLIHICTSAARLKRLWAIPPAFPAASASPCVPPAR